jgi:hypothetical protein
MILMMMISWGLILFYKSISWEISVGSSLGVLNQVSH